MGISRRQSGRNKGATIIYISIMLVGMMAFASLGVDLAHVQLAKTELRRTVDASARYGASGLALDSATAKANAIALAGDKTNAGNWVDGQPLVLDANQDIIIGYWDTQTRTFTTSTTSPNAVQVIGRKTAARNSAIPMTFAGLFGQKTCNINNVSAIAMYISGVNVNQNVPATANPFLAGMPAGTVASLNNPHNSPDYAGTTSNPRQSPLQVSMNLTPGTSLAFDNITGDVRHDPNLAYYSPDGELDAIGDNTDGSEHGISDLYAPINALVGVFLSDAQPDQSVAPQTLDFSTPASRNFTSLQPELKQLFFIGDGRTDSGAAQNFVVPKGATRLYLATWDFFEWNNNAGARNVVVQRPTQIQLVK